MIICNAKIFLSQTRCQPGSKLSGEEDGEDTDEVAADEPGEDVGEGAGGGDGRQPHEGLAKVIAVADCQPLYLVRIFTSFCGNDSCIQKHDWLTFSSPVPCQQSPCILDPK